MHKINLQSKTSPEKGKIQLYYFERILNGVIEKTLYHKIHIPLKPFLSGLSYEPQPMKTLIVFELNLKLDDYTDLNGIRLVSKSKDEYDVSVYVGAAHNPCDIENMTLKQLAKYSYQIECILSIDFEHEDVALNEIFEFKTILDLDPIIQ